MRERLSTSSNVRETHNSSSLLTPRFVPVLRIRFCFLHISKISRLNFFVSRQSRSLLTHMLEGKLRYLECVCVCVCVCVCEFVYVCVCVCVCVCV